jgi:hypothetical protein
MQGATEAVVTIATAIIGVAILAVLVSQKSNTTGVIQAFGSAFSNALGVAESPVTGSQVNINTSYPSSTSGGFGLQSLPQLNMLAI